MVLQGWRDATGDGLPGDGQAFFAQFAPARWANCRMVTPIGLRPTLATMTAPFFVPQPDRHVDIVSLIVTNVTPVAGILFLHWSPMNLVAIYSIDMTLSLVTLIWLVMTHVTEANDPDRSLWHTVKIGMAACLVGLLVASVLVTPMLALFLQSGWIREQAYLDPGFRTALAIQVVGSFVACARTHRMLDQRSDDDRYLGDAFKFLVARWIFVVGIVFFGIGSILDEQMGSMVVVVVYAAGTIWFTLFPEQVNRLFPRDKTKSGTGTAR
jgi:hypothetical protein